MKAIVSLLTIAASVYVLLGLALYLLQERMVFLADLPGRALTASPADIGLAFEDVTLHTRDGERLHGWYIPAGPFPTDGATDVPASAPSDTADHAARDAGAEVAASATTPSRGVLLFFHGNAGNISHRLDSLAIFHQLGLDTLIIDYRGYGQSSGRPSEAGTYRDAQAAWDYLVRERGVTAGRIIIFGRSLGGAVAAWLGSRHTPAAVIIESTFSSGVDMARRLYPFLPARLLTRLRYPVTDYVRQLQCPVLVVHSHDDEIIPFTMGQAIHAAVPGRKTFLELRGDHNNGFLLSRADYMAGLEAFVGEVWPGR